MATYEIRSQGRFGCSAGSEIGTAPALAGAAHRPSAAADTLRSLGEGGSALDRLELSAPSRSSAGRFQTLNEEPQPQVPLTFGLPNLKPDPWTPST